MDHARNDVLAVLLVTLAVCSGCNQVHWRAGLDQALKEGERENRLVLVYYWRAFDKDCQRMDAEVFRTEEVLDQVNEMIPVKLDATFSRTRGEQLGLREAPSFIVIAPNGEFLRRSSGVMDVDQFLAFLVVARLSR